MSTDDRSRNNPKLNVLLLFVAAVYLGILGALTLFSLGGFSFGSQALNTILNIASLTLAVPMIMGLYLNRSRVWASAFLCGIPVVLIFSPVPSNFLAKVAIVVTIVPFFFLPGTNRWQKWLVGLPVGLAIFFILITSPIWAFALIISGGGAENTSTSFSPDGDYQIEVVIRNGGATGGFREVNLYRNYPWTIRRFKRELLEGDYADRVIIKWIDNRNVEIEGERINILADRAPIEKY